MAIEKIKIEKIQLIYSKEQAQSLMNILNRMINAIDTIEEHDFTNEEMDEVSELLEDLCWNEVSDN